jgi:hypothetical protein
VSEACTDRATGSFETICWQARKGLGESDSSH